MGRPVSIQQNPSTTGHSSRCKLVQISFARVLAALPSCSVWGVIWLFSHAQGYQCHPYGMARLRLASSRSGFVRLVLLRLEYWQGSRRRPRVGGCGWWSAGPPCGGLAGRGAYLACLGRFGGRGRRCGRWLVLYLSRAPWRALAAQLRAFGVMAGACLSVPLAWPSRAARGWRWRGLDWWRVALAAVAVRAAPVAAVAVAGAPVKRARRRGPYTGRGGVALVAWSECQRTGATGVAGVIAVL